MVEFGERKFYQSTRFNIDEFNAFFAIVRHLTPYVGHADGRLANITTKYRVVLVLVRLATGVAFHNDGNQPYYTQTSQSLVNGTTFLNLDMIQFEEVTVGNITQLRMKFDDSLTVRNVAGEDCQSHEG